MNALRRLASTAVATITVGTIAAAPTFLFTPHSFGQDAAPEDKLARVEAINALRSEFVWVRQTLEEKLLTPRKELRETHAKFLASQEPEEEPSQQGKRGLTRVLRGYRPEGQVIDGLSMRGGGAYFSFATGSHSYDDEPDLSFRGGRLSSGFYGGQTGYVVSLGERSLASIGANAEVVPAGLDKDQALAWRHLWSDLRDPASPARHAAPPELRKLRSSVEPKAAGQLFLLRLFSSDEHEHLVAFEVLELDDYGCTILWRVLKTWEVDERRPTVQTPKRPTAKAPRSLSAELASMSIDRLFGRLEDVCERANLELFSVPEELASRYEAKLGGEPGADSDTASDLGPRGIARILNRGSYPVLATVRGNGAYYSFFAASHSYNDNPDIQLERGMFSSGFAGSDTGYFADLGILDAESLGRATRRQDPAVDPAVDPKSSKRWKLLTQLEPVQDRGRWVLELEDLQRAHPLQITDVARVKVGHSYLLRTACYGDKDHETIFTVLSATEDSCIIAWHLVHRHSR